MTTATPTTRSATEARADLRITDVVRFHLPLAATFFSYGIVFNIINSTLSGFRDAAFALAAFAVGMGIVDLFTGPAGSGNQWLLSRGRDRRSFARGGRVMVEIALAVTSLLALVAFTPAGRWLSQGVFGAPESLVPHITAVIRVALMSPLVWAWRNISQCILMLRRQTHFISIGVFIRLGFVAGCSALLARQGLVQGAAAGGLLWIGGMAVEAVFLFSVARPAYQRLPAAGGPLPTRASVLRFLAPLMATGLMWATARPLANAAMARTVQAENAIAAFQIGWLLSFLMIAVQIEFRQVFVVLWSDRQSRETLRRYGLWLSGILASTALLCGLTGVSAWFMRRVLGTPENLINPANWVFVVSSLGAVVWMLIELQIGQLLRVGKTAIIGVAKGVNLVAMALLMLALVRLAPGLGPIIGTLGYMVGATVEAATLYWATRGLSLAPAGGD